PIRIMRADVAIRNPPQRVMSDITGDGAVIVVLRDYDVGGLLPAELTNFVHDATQDVSVHLRGVDRVVCPWAVRVVRCVWLLRPEDREVRHFLREDVIDEYVGQIREPTPGEGPGAVERILGFSIVEPLSR